MKTKIGLVLGGGGAKGAYQAGVLKALEDFKLLDKIDMVSGTSIGALNAMKVLDGDIDGCVNIWKNVTRDIALSKSSFLTKIKTKALFSRDGFKKLAKEKIDLTKASNSKIPCYIIATPLGKNTEDAPTEFLINGKSEEEILNYLLATSALPYVFEQVTIDGVRYMDGYGVATTPVETLKNKGCNLIYVVPLHSTSDANKFADKNTTIIDFVSSSNDQGIMDGTLDFEANSCKQRMDIGYSVATKLIEQLIKDKIIGVSFYQKMLVKFKKTFSRKYKNSEHYYALDNDIVNEIRNKKDMK